MSLLHPTHRQSYSPKLEQSPPLWTPPHYYHSSPTSYQDRKQEWFARVWARVPGRTTCLMWLRSITGGHLVVVSTQTHRQHYVSPLTPSLLYIWRLPRPRPLCCFMTSLWQWLNMYLPMLLCLARNPCLNTHFTRRLYNYYYHAHLSQISSLMTLVPWL